MRKFIFFCFLSPFFQETSAQTVTWSEDIACIIYSHCGSCHGNENTLATIPLMSYEDVFNNRLAVELYTNTRKMPPALASDQYSHLANNKRLTENEIRLIREWALNDALRGDSTKEPAPPVFNTPVTTLSNPDISERIPDFIVPDSAGHFRKCFVLTPAFISSKVIRAVEVVPGNISAVHGIFLYSDTSSVPLELDANDAGAGYTHFYGIGSTTAKQFFSWVPGTKAFSFPEGIGLQIDSGARIIMQLEYSDEAGGRLDSSRANIQFDSDTSLRKAIVSPLLTHETDLLNGPFVIPVDSIVKFHEQRIMSQEVTLLSISPAMHQICTDMEVFAVLPGNDTIGLLFIEDWDPVWNEGTYYFKRPVTLPVGAVLHAFATFNNTPFNIHEPGDTLKEVHAGLEEEDEEMIFYFTHLPYKPGDENIIIDSLPHYAHYMDCKSMHVIAGSKQVESYNTNLEIYPNPNSGKVHFVIKDGLPFEPYMLTIINMLGEEVNKVNVKSRDYELNTSMLSTGIYIAQITCSGRNFLFKIIRE